MAQTYLTDIDRDDPPSGLSRPEQALWWLAKDGYVMGDGWPKAHEIAQSNEGERDHDLAHAIAHLVEGDEPNAGYWFRRAGHTPVGGGIAAEADAVAAVIAG